MVHVLFMSLSFSRVFYRCEYYPYPLFCLWFPLCVSAWLKRILSFGRHLCFLFVRVIWIVCNVFHLSSALASVEGIIHLYIVYNKNVGVHQLGYVRIGKSLACLTIQLVRCSHWICILTKNQT